MGECYRCKVDGPTHLYISRDNVNEHLLCDKCYIKQLALDRKQVGSKQVVI